MKIIGLTGSIGMGKSTIAKMLKDLGVPVFDADHSVHLMLSSEDFLVDKIGRFFPEVLKILNNKKYIDRKILGEIVFKNKEKKNILENILHPEVGRRRKKWKSYLQRENYKAICYDVPLLFETGGDKACDCIIVVTAPFFIQKQRVLRRKNMSNIKFFNILNNQFPDSEKRKRADYIVNTGNGYRHSRDQLIRIVKKILL